MTPAALVQIHKYSFPQESFRKVAGSYLLLARKGQDQQPSWCLNCWVWKQAQNVRFNNCCSKDHEELATDRLGDGILHSEPQYSNKGPKNLAPFIGCSTSQTPRDGHSSQTDLIQVMQKHVFWLFESWMLLTLTRLEANDSKKEQALKMTWSLLWVTCVCVNAYFFCCFCIAPKTLWVKPAFRLMAAADVVGGMLLLPGVDG